MQRPEKLLLPLLLLAVCGCSYYGTVVEYHPDSTAIDLDCGATRVEVFSIEQKPVFSSRAIFGIPIAPASNPPGTEGSGYLSTYYADFGSYDVCKTEDLVLIDKNRNLSIAPVNTSIYRHPANPASQVSCFYLLHDLVESEELVLAFEDGFLGCEIPEVTLKRKSRFVNEWRLLQ